MKWLLLQVDPSDAKRFSEYGPIGVMLTITIGVVGLLSVLLFRSWQNQMKEKNKENENLKNEIRELRNEVRAMQNGIMRDATEIMENCAIAIREGSSQAGRLEGFISRRDEHIETLFNRVLDVLSNHK